MNILPARFYHLAQAAKSHFPGIGLTVLVTCFALLASMVETRLLGRVWLGGLVLAILFGMALRSFGVVRPVFDPGIRFCVKTVLEFAVFLLGSSMSLQILAQLGYVSVLGIFALVLISLVIGYACSRLLRLHPKLAVLIACGNSICGNSAIAAAAPVIRAGTKDVAAAISFTAAFGVMVVLLLPFLQIPLGLTDTQYGMFAGLTVYAVPQVLAATAAVSIISLQIGTLVKLVRVLMLAPVLVILGIVFRNEGEEIKRKLSFGDLIPWFVIGFMVLMALRSANMIPDILIAPMAHASHILTLIAMAALGLSVDIRTITKSGGKILCAAFLSLLALAVLSLGFITLVEPI